MELTADVDAEAEVPEMIDYHNLSRSPAEFSHAARQPRASM